MDSARQKVGKMTNGGLESLMEDSVPEGKRTTQTVRAPARFTLIEVTMTLIAGVPLGFIALVGGSAFVLGGAVLVIGGPYALMEGGSEFKQSEIGSGQNPHGHIDPIGLCKSCEAELHPFLCKCPPCDEKDGVWKCSPTN